ncbi:MAG TPA: hypothetical protein VNI01_11075 [Elusimicrobiota bacterium]|nr:hypothetical protein [Elusimicrobiota bacterium]
MARFPRPLKVLLNVLAVYAAFFALRGAADRWGAVRLEAGAPLYRHYDIIDIHLETRDPSLLARWRSAPPSAVVLRGGAAVRTVAGIVAVPLAWRAGSRSFVGRWPCPWNAPDGEYRLALLGEDALRARLRTGAFRVERRKTAPVPRRFAVLTWESVRPLATEEVRAPDGTMKDWRGLLDWVQYAGADGFWMLVGQTPGKAPGELWNTANLDMAPKVAAECRRRGLKFGVYAENYLTMSSSNLVPGYEYAIEMEDGKIVSTRAVSLRETKRPADVAALLKRFRDIPGVDWLGLDYIRNALGGYELIDQFFAEMPGVRPPAGWERLSREERVLWFARKKILRKDAAFIDAWQWWRAHYVSGIIRRLKAELGDSKPIWAFTLTWERGWQHGQDPVMFCDAGVDLDALMLYEATAEQFEYMVKDWSSYLKRSDAPLMVGDIVDQRLHQNSPRGPGELFYRLQRAMDRIHPDGPPRGLFVHDLERALHGRLGGYSTKDWMDQARAAIKRFKSLPEAP